MKIVATQFSSVHEMLYPHLIYIYIQLIIFSMLIFDLEKGHRCYIQQREYICLRKSFMNDKENQSFTMTYVSDS